jgi:hypothetical protein
MSDGSIEIIPSLSKYLTRSAVDFIASFPSMFCLWALIVFTLTNNRTAISLEGTPSAISLSISDSLSVNTGSDPAQTGFLNVRAEPESLEFEVKALAGGDSVEGLNFLLTR